MRIALLSAEYPPTPGGIGDYTRRLGEALTARGLAVAIWTIRAGQLRSLDPLEQRADQLVGPASWGWRCWAAIAAGLRRERPDVLHIQYQTGAYQMHPAINLLPFWIRRQADRPRLVVTAHDLLVPYLFPKAGPLRAWVTRRLLEDCDLAVVTNESDLAALSIGDSDQDATLASLPRFTGRLRTTPQLIPIGSNIVVAPPADYERNGWRARLGVAPDERLIAYFGLISPTKGLDELLDALLRLPTEFRLLVVGGEAPAPQDQAYAARLRARLNGPELTGRVIVTGHCPEHEVSAHLLAADLAALPFADGASFRRGSLLAVLAHGLPTVTTSSVRMGVPGSQAPQLADGANIRLVRAGDTTALTAALTQLAHDPVMRLRLAEGARALAAHFAWPMIAESHERLYRHLRDGV